MNKILKFIKNEFSGWNKYEKIFLSLAVIIIIVLSIYFKDSKIATISAITGISYTFLAGKCRISCYIFGAITSVLYSWISFKNQVYGNMLLNMLYYLPMDFVGITTWKKHLKKDVQEVEKTNLTNKEKIIYFGLTLLGVIISYILLKYLKDQTPLLDSISTIASIVGLILTVKRCIEQWYIWFLVNGLTTIIWIIAYLNGSNCIATALMWFIYWLLSIYFMVTWKKELS